MELSITEDLFDPAKHSQELMLRGLAGRVLVLEDDTALKTVVTRIFKKIDPRLDVSWAVTLDDAYRDLQDIRFDSKQAPQLILSDIYLPNFELGTSLYEKCRRIFPHTPFVFMSSMPANHYIDIMGPQTKTPPFISKPISVIECERTLGSLLS